MAVAFNNEIQRMVTLAGLRMEVCAGVTIAGVSGQSFTVTSKLRRVWAGFGVMDTDGGVCKATPGDYSTAGGQVTMTRLAPIETSADTATFVLYGW